MTLRENNLKEIKGGNIMESQGILVANRQSLLDRPGLLQVGDGRKLLAGAAEDMLSETLGNADMHLTLLDCAGGARAD